MRQAFAQAHQIACGRSTPRDRQQLRRGGLQGTCPRNRCNAGVPLLLDFGETPLCLPKFLYDLLSPV